MATVKGFWINSMPFRITGQSHGESPQYTVLEEWVCGDKVLTVRQSPEDLFRIAFTFGSAEETKRLLATLGFFHGSVTEQQLGAVLRRVFGGVSPRPPSTDEIAAAYRECYSYRLEFVRKHIIVELEAFVFGGYSFPPVGVSIVGQVAIPYAYAFVLSAFPDCCDNLEPMNREIIDSWNAFRPPNPVDVGAREPMRSVLRKAKEQIDNNQTPPLRPPGVDRPFGLLSPLQPDQLEDDAPKYQIGG